MKNVPFWNKLKAKYTMKSEQTAKAQHQNYYEAKYLFIFKRLLNIHIK